MARTAEQDKVRELQRTLYRAAKADPGRRFHALYDKVYRRDVLGRAWELVRANRGAAGIDRQTIAAVEEYGVAKLLDELAADLKQGRWRPLPARRVFIPKPGGRSAVRSRFLRSATALCRRPPRSSSSRSSSPTCWSARSGSGPGARRTTLSRCSSMRRGGAGDGSPSRTSPTVWSHRHTACALMGVVSKSAVSGSGTRIRRPLRRPLRTWMASSSPRLTRCNTVWRLTPRRRMASTIGT
jgi:hypothetical protein